MRTHRKVLALFVTMLIVAITAPAARAQADSVLYRIESGQFSRGCYPPCTCPLYTTTDLRGTYTLTLSSVGPLFTTYKVNDVNWVVPLGGQDTRITGSGEYKVGGEVASQQQMTLKLTVGTEAPQTFDSGLVSGGQNFPAINITMSVNGMQCFDTVIQINSKPVPSSDVIHFGLKDSTYDEGCFPPCLCPLHVWPIQGPCDLVPLQNATTPIHHEWAVVNVHWNSLSTTPVPERRFVGFGTYAITEVGPSEEQRMVLDVTELNSNTANRFDSGTVSGGNFPTIDINLAVNGFYCDDKAFFLHLRPQ
jgi:hypothetical protein